MKRNQVSALVCHLPNFLTFCNMTTGVVAIILATNGYYVQASLFILLGGIFDRYDGIVARKLNVNSEIGKQMDSLADIITFGLAPALVALFFPLAHFKYLGYFAAIVFITSGWYRLSRFNISPASSVFTGMPITVAGGLLSIDLLYQATYSVHPGFTVFLMLLLSFLMTSQYKIKKL